MNYSLIIDALEQNCEIFKRLLEGQSAEVYLYRPSADHWCLLEIICHLYDEEREDFRHRLETTLKYPGTHPSPIDPRTWVVSRAYMEQNYNEKIQAFLKERNYTIQWLRSLDNPQWSNAYEHPQLGTVTAHHFISNWLAHDYLHIRQIIRVKYNFLKVMTGESLKYAGDW
jgi:hypothetical protein